MADNRGYSQNYGYGAYPITGAAYGGYGNGGRQQPSTGKTKLSKKEQRRREEKARLKEYNRIMRARQNYAVENVAYRGKVAAIDGYGGIDSRYYHLPADVKPKKEKDYFFVMRKIPCLIMFIVMLLSIAYFALGFVKIDAIPAQYTALYMETEPKKAEDTGDETEGENGEEAEAPANADGDTEEGESGSDAAGEEGEAEESKGFQGTAYSVLDPVFGFLKFVGGKLGTDINLGDSPMYDSMVAKVEVGMSNSLAQYITYAMPVALIVYLITAIIMLIKAFCGMFGKRIFKMFGLGSIIMVLCGLVTALGGLAFITDVSATSMDFGSIVNILIGGLTGVGGFTGGYGLLILIVLPVLTLIFSIFARKKVPYSIFDTYGE